LLVVGSYLVVGMIVSSGQLSMGSYMAAC